MVFMIFQLNLPVLLTTTKYYFHDHVKHPLPEVLPKNPLNWLLYFIILATSPTRQGNHCQTTGVKFKCESKSLNFFKNLEIRQTKNKKQNQEIEEGTVIMGRNKQSQAEKDRNWKKQEETKTKN